MPGGVCAVLDYETDLMAEYVAEMAMRVVIPNGTVTGAFRKFVSQILTSTRLPSTTILLGMNYLAKRINMLNSSGPFKAQEGQVWRMLTVALLLGSKFLDDNTFQNRSWSEVSGIAVSELNTMENEWLRHIGWMLYVNLDQSHDYNAWLKSWKDWQETRQRHQLQQQQAQQAQQQQQKSQFARGERLASIITSLPQDSFRHHPLSYEGWTPEEIAEQERINLNARLGRASKVSSGSYRRDGWHNQPYSSAWPQAQAPLTPPDSGYGTPEYLNSAASVNSRYNDWFSHAIAPGSNYSRSYHSANPNSFSRSSSHHQSNYSHGHYHWDHSPYDMNCGQCFMSGHNKAAPYLQPYPFGQAVA